MSKTFQHASRADAQSIDPKYLCIIGGKALPKDEQGPLDTEPDPSSPFHAHDLLRPLDPRDVEDVFEQGVIVPIEVIRVNDVPVVNAGRGRVRKARLANLRRAAEGLPLIEVKFIVVRLGLNQGLQLFRRALSENLRRKTMGLHDQIELAKQLLALGASEEEAARYMDIPKSRLNEVLAFEDNASPAVKAAIQQDRLSPSAGFVLAAIKDPAEQDAKLAELLTAPKPTVRAAKQLQRGKEAAVAPPRRPAQKKLLACVEKHAKGNDWMQGARAVLKWVTEGTLHRDLASLLESADEEEATTTKKKG